MHRLQEIVGKSFSGIWRAVDMLALDLGGEVSIFEPYDPEDTLRAEFSLRFMCQWRFIMEGRILLASRDIYVPYDPELEADTEWEYDLTGRPDAQSSIFDVQRRAVEQRLQDCTVSAASVNEMGDLRIAFSNGAVFESFTPSSRADEFWRMIRFYPDRKAEHIVFFET